MKTHKDIVAEFHEKCWIHLNLPDIYDIETRSKAEMIMYESIINWLTQTLQAHDLALLEEIERRIEGIIYKFERPKEDYLPEVYKHLKSKAEALTEAKSIAREVISNQEKVWCCDCGRRISFPVPDDEYGNCIAGGTHHEKSKYMNAPLVEEVISNQE